MILAFFAKCPSILAIVGFVPPTIEDATIRQSVEAELIIAQEKARDRILSAGKESLIKHRGGKERGGKKK